MAEGAAAFRGSADAYDRFMGRYSLPLAERMLELAAVEPGERALDVGCGPGTLTAALAARLGAENVAALDPSEPYVEACRERVPGADVRLGRAEELPFADGRFDVALSQLVFHFVSDGEAAARELRRVLRAGGRAAACVWDARGEMTLLRTFWAAAVALDPAAPEESRLPYVREGELADLWRRTGFHDVIGGALDVEASYADFDEFWNAILGGVGPIGAYTAALGEERRTALREELRRRLGDPPGEFRLPARAWCAVGRA